VLGVRSFDLFSKYNPAMTMLSAILAGGMSSRLFQKLREELGVAYYVRANNNPSTDHGYFSISAGVTNKRVGEVIKEILKECKEMTKTLVSEKELKKAKSMIIGNMKMSLEATDDIANFYGAQEILKNNIRTISEKCKVIEAVTSKDVQDIAKKVFVDENLHLALIGPFRDSKVFEPILKF
jgi:predicted Zn-dependent peptidase